MRAGGAGQDAPAGGGRPLVPRVLQSRAVPPGVRTRPASVLMLFGEGGGAADAVQGVPRTSGGVPDGDVLLTQRAATLRHHSGQVAFPGGAADPGDGGPVQTALREAEEETGLRPDGVQPLTVMPELFVPPSRFLVSPVLAYWREPCPVRVVDEAETSRVARVPLADLVNPANRFQVRYRKVFTGPAFTVDGMLVWGFTAGLLSALITEAGWEQEWDTGDVRELDVTLPEVDEQATRR
ncbi:NUDIX hydrolase [Tomitella fengzijianii]|uniref:CoA pyrophosphatase n=1 Tax=Tomitella fengzijianii TaxID=2597660 RepID=A0A516X7B9_9ACTN|nr:CoA pyrophosphatase [Tomitella fengzijianii]